MCRECGVDFSIASEEPGCDFVEEFNFINGQMQSHVVYDWSAYVKQQLNEKWDELDQDHIQQLVEEELEDGFIGEISKEKYKKMTSDYEAEQERLKLEIETTEEWVEQRQAMGDDLDAFIALTKKYVDVTELTQTIVNEYIKKIIIHAPDKSGGKRRQKVEIIFNFVDEVENPVLAEPMIAESTLGRRKTA